MTRRHRGLILCWAPCCVYIYWMVCLGISGVAFVENGVCLSVVSGVRSFYSDPFSARNWMGYMCRSGIFCKVVFKLWKCVCWHLVLVDFANERSMQEWCVVLEYLIFVRSLSKYLKYVCWHLGLVHFANAGMVTGEASSLNKHCVGTKECFECRLIFLFFLHWAAVLFTDEPWKTKPMLH